MKIKKMINKSDFKEIFPLVLELRPLLTEEKYFAMIDEAGQRDNFEMVVIYKNDLPVGIMGYRILFDFVHGKHLYIDDLIVSPESRSKGIGAELLKYAECIARDKGLEGLRLCTGIDNLLGKKFYEREGWSAKAIAFKKKI